MAATLPGITTRMSGGLTYEIIAGRKHHGHGKHQWVYACEHPDCGRKDNPAEHPTTCRDAGGAQKAAWDHARRAHPDDTAVIKIQGRRVNHELDPTCLFAEVHEEVAGLLGCPLPGGIGSDSDDADTPAGPGKDRPYRAW